MSLLHRWPIIKLKMHGEQWNGDPGYLWLHSTGIREWNLVYITTACAPHTPSQTFRARMAHGDYQEIACFHSNNFTHTDWIPLYWWHCLGGGTITLRTISCRAPFIWSLLNLQPTEQWLAHRKWLKINSCFILWTGSALYSTKGREIA
jgi:hypothetical protein